MERIIIGLVLVSLLLIVTLSYLWTTGYFYYLSRTDGVNTNNKIAIFKHPDKVLNEKEKSDAKNKKEIINNPHSSKSATSPENTPDRIAMGYPEIRAAEQLKSDSHHEAKSVENGNKVPGFIQGEDFSNMSGVEVLTAEDNSGIRFVGNFETGDWMDYNVSVEKTGWYTITYIIASKLSTGAFELYVNNNKKSGKIVPNTGGWFNWWQLYDGIYLNKGNCTIRFLSTGKWWNLDSFSIKKQ